MKRTVLLAAIPGGCMSDDETSCHSDRHRMKAVNSTLKDIPVDIWLPAAGEK